MIQKIKDALDSLTNTMFSGGAKGADRLFGLWAKKNNFNVIHFSYPKHRHHVEQSEIFEIDLEILNSKTIKDALKLANKKLGRSVPPEFKDSYKLLARNYFQVLSTERVYAIANLESPTLVQGGTSWAIQMFIDHSTNPEIYVYSPFDKCAYSYCNIKKEFVICTEIPTPYGNWTGIGSRDATSTDMDSFERYFV